MSIVARATQFAAAFTLVAVSRLDAQSGTLRVTIGGGQHAGTYEMSDQCEVRPDSYPALYLMAFTTGTADSKLPRTMEFFTASEKGKPDGFVVAVKFLGARQNTYEIFAIPRDLTPSAPPVSGRGTVTVKRTATGQVATFSGRTKDGVKMDGTLDCRSKSS